jgi:hypothetical protein
VRLKLVEYEEITKITPFLDLKPCIWYWRSKLYAFTYQKTIILIVKFLRNCVILGFRRGINGIFDLLGYYAA